MPRASTASRSPCLATLAALAPVLALTPMLALASLAACRPAATPAPTTTPADPPPFAPAPRYTTTFTANSTGCRGSIVAAYDGAAVLTIAPDQPTTFELTLTPKDVLGPVDIVFSPPAAPRAPSTTTCRWSGTSTPAPGRWLASLEPSRDPQSTSVCGDPVPLALDCAPIVLPVLDASGTARETSLLRCAVASPGPAALWVLAFDILLSEQALHQQVETSSFGLSHQTLSLGPPSPPPGLPAPREPATAHDPPAPPEPRSPSDAATCR